MELGVGNFGKPESGVGNFGKVVVGVFFPPDYATLVEIKPKEKILCYVTELWPIAAKQLERRGWRAKQSTENVSIENAMC